MPDDAGNSGLDSSLDISSILSPSTSGTPETTGGAGGGNGDQAGSGESAAFKFGGRSYQSQKAAEDAHNKLYGQYSEKQAILNQIKSALKNPEAFARFSKDPNFAPILAKLGIQGATEELEQEVEEDEFGKEQANLPPALQKLAQEIKYERAVSQLEREKWAFERKLGREMTPEENDGVFGIINKADTLSMAEAWKLYNHDKVQKELAELKASSKNRPAGNRPPPLPPGIPGQKLDLKKSISAMNTEEWRENLRQSDEFRNLTSR